MITVPILMVVLFALWTVVLLAFTVGIYRWGSVFLGKAQVKDFPADDIRGGDFYKRAMRAHANCVENLPVFMAVVFAAHFTGTQSDLISLMSVVAFVARVFQSLVHVSFVQGNRIVSIRFTLFLIQLVCFVGIAIVVLRSGMQGWA